MWSTSERFRAGWDARQRLNTYLEETLERVGFHKNDEDAAAEFGMSVRVVALARKNLRGEWKAYLRIWERHFALWREMDDKYDLEPEVIEVAVGTMVMMGEFYAHRIVLRAAGALQEIARETTDNAIGWFGRHYNIDLHTALKDAEVCAQYERQQAAATLARMFGTRS